MKILLLGKIGQVGWELQRSLASLGELIALDRREADFENSEQLRACIRHHAPTIIVNACAYTAVDKAESEASRAQQINCDAVAILAAEAKALDAWLIHYSTDYVFDGSGNTPKKETDLAAPLNVYGQTKLDGEVAIQRSGCKHLIFRTSWVYAARGNNFAKTILRLAHERDSLSVINDQIGSPTSAELIADITAHALRVAQQHPHVSGLYHLVASGNTTWHNYACFVVDQAIAAGLPLLVVPSAIDAVPTTAFPTPAQRPLNSRLNTEKLQSTFGLTLPDWQLGVAHTLTELFEQVKKAT
jgi:dTDP-4-dehydrorhamnose reductase